MLFTCRRPGFEESGERIPGRFPGPVHARGKWFAIDIHCHVRCEKAAAMVEGTSDVSRWFLETSADARSREINRQNGVRTRAQGASPETRIADMDRMGIDIQAISPFQWVRSCVTTQRVETSRSPSISPMIRLPSDRSARHRLTYIGTSTSMRKAR